MKLSPGAKGLGYLSPALLPPFPPPLAIAAGLRSSTSPPHCAAGLNDARALCSGCRGISSTRHLDLRACPRHPLDRRVREAPPPTGLDTAPVHLRPNRARGELPHALLILSDPFPLSFRHRHWRGAAAPPRLASRRRTHITGSPYAGLHAAAAPPEATLPPWPRARAALPPPGPAPAGTPPPPCHGVRELGLGWASH